MQLKAFLKNLGVGCRIHELVFVAMPVCSLLYGLTPKQILSYLEWIMIGVFLLTFIIFSIQAVRVARNIFSTKKPDEIQIPELYDLANKMKYNLVQKPFLIVNKKNIKAQSNLITKQITFGKAFFNKLTSEEKIFVGGHEFFHIYGKEYLYLLITIVPAVVILSAIPTLLGVPSPVILFGVIGSVIVSFLCYSRSYELLADQAGVNHVNKEIASNALKKAYPGRTDRGYYLHPSVDKRIKKLQ